MTLLNKKANQNDRISDLSSNVILQILGNLRIRDQVRTSILSRKWRYIWTSSPQIRFDLNFFEIFMPLDDPNPNPIVAYKTIDDPNPNPIVAYKTISDVLMLHNGPIHKFDVCIGGDFDFEISTENLNIWIPFMSKDIKHLELMTRCTSKDQMPDILFSCNELTYFKFSGFNLSIPPNSCGFKKLLELHLFMVTFQSRALESLVSSCPFLEKLSIEYCDGCDYLVISSPSLKVLVLLELIDTKSICLNKAKNLIDFTLEDYLGRGLVKSLPIIKRLSLVRGEKNPYVDIIPHPVLASSLSSLEYLKLGGLNLNDNGDILYFVRVLTNAPRLIELVIRQSYDNVDTRLVSHRSKELECRGCGLKLQTVDIHIRANHRRAMSLIKFILANSPSLKILTIYCLYNKLDVPMLLQFSQDLLRMERASPEAQILVI